jgi:hypothetical protein
MTDSSGLSPVTMNVDRQQRGGDLRGELAPPKDVGELGQHRRAGEDLDALLTRGLKQHARRPAPQDGRRHHVRIEHHPRGGRFSSRRAAL